MTDGQDTTPALYVVGDIHGELDQLQRAMERIERDGGSDARVVFLGDYIDRGPDSKGVIQYLIDGLARGKDWVCLLGNHDRMFRMFLEDYPRHDSQFLVGYHWLHERIGGVECLQSYGVELGERERTFKLHPRVLEAMPAEHKAFLNALKYYHLDGDRLFVHAGILPGVALEDQDDSDLIWIRDEFHAYTGAHPWLIVHGHTPIAAPTHYGNRINLDAGCAYGRDLTVAVFEGRECWIVTDNGRSFLAPPN